MGSFHHAPHEPRAHSREHAGHLYVSLEAQLKGVLVPQTAQSSPVPLMLVLAPTSSIVMRHDVGSTLSATSSVPLLALEIAPTRTPMLIAYLSAVRGVNAWTSRDGRPHDRRVYQRFSTTPSLGMPNLYDSLSRIETFLSGGFTSEGARSLNIRAVSILALRGRWDAALLPGAQSDGQT